MKRSTRFGSGERKRGKLTDEVLDFYVPVSSQRMM